MSALNQDVGSIVSQNNQAERKMLSPKWWVMLAYNLWSDLSVRLKLYLLVSIGLISFTVAMVYLVETGKRDINNLTTVLYSATIRSTTELVDADKNAQHILLEHKKYTYTGGNSGSETTAASMEPVINKVSMARDELKQLGVLDKILYRDTNKTLNMLFDDLDIQLADWSSEITKPSASEEALDGLFTNIGSTITKITSSLESYSKTHIQAAEQEALRKERFGLAMLVVVMLATLVLAGLTIRHIVSTLHSVNTKLTKVTSGDLTVAPEQSYSQDDLGQLSKSVDTTVMDLRKIISLIMANATVTEQAMHSVVSGSQAASEKTDSVVSSMESMSISVTSQFTGIMETGRAVEEMAAGVNRIAETTTQIADNSTAMNTSATHGLESVLSLIAQMSDILEANSTLENVVSSLSSKSAEMNQIVSSISGFAEDTNLLSLNASLEAARAGEHGRGFLVVAAEMRRLSDNSRQAAQEVSTILSETVEDIRRASTLMHQSAEVTRLGNASAAEVNAIFQTIISSVASITSQLHEASAVTEQMSASSEEVAATMGELTNAADAVSGMVGSVNTAATAQKAVLSDVVRSSVNLEQVVAELRASVDSFRL
ncbi:methyl-accepting chemotaxis protein [Paenibacillus tengchongensis]|uniref:methyl-accepting chemotaxis protein n=1 Tax=Paenibacillus tengchongensis TaxID=2608684 RepID=UPI00124E9305|nr:methyl-accepting chemotaxis protein [Paenibacillus tengchongensis]